MTEVSLAINVVEAEVAHIDVVETDVELAVSVLEGPRGPRGYPGVDGGGDVSANASTALGGHRAVAWTSDGEFEYADSSNPAHKNTTVGITKGAASSGAAVDAQSQGVMSEPSWSWTPLGTVFLGTNGLLTQTPPSAPNFILVLGHAIDATSMWIHLQSPIIQA